MFLSHEETPVAPSDPQGRRCGVVAAAARIDDPGRRRLGRGRQCRDAPGPRLVCVYVPHGAVMSHWTPAKVGAGFEFPEILKPLEPFRERVNVVSGLSLPLAYGQDASAGANHTRSSAVYLSGAKPGTGSEAELGITVDQVAAKHIGQDSPLPSLELSIEDGSLSCGAGLSCAYRNTISWQGPKSPLPMENNPQVVFERLFGDGAPRSSAPRGGRGAQPAGLDHLGSGLAAEDSAGHRSRAPRPLSHRRARGRAAHRARRATGAAGTEAAEPRPSGIPDDFETHIKLMFDLQVLAWQADITRVTTLMFAKEVSNAIFPASGIREPFHNLSHHSNVPDNIAKLAQLNQYHVEDVRVPGEEAAGLPGRRRHAARSLARHVRQRHEQQQPARSPPLPIVLAGGARGKLQGGRHIHVDGRADAVESAAGDAAQARRAGGVVRRQHRRGGDLESPCHEDAICELACHRVRVRDRRPMGRRGTRGCRPVARARVPPASRILRRTASCKEYGSCSGITPTSMPRVMMALPPCTGSYACRISRPARLLRAGADANGANRYGVRPLHIAIAKGDLAMVRLLLDAKADPTSADATGETCLMMAANTGRLDIVNALLDKKAPVDARDPAIPADRADVRRARRSHRCRASAHRARRGCERADAHRQGAAISLAGYQYRLEGRRHRSRRLARAWLARTDSRSEDAAAVRGTRGSSGYGDNCC